MGGVSESDLAVLNNTLSQDLSDYGGPDAMRWRTLPN
jgi:hypothetical protein